MYSINIVEYYLQLGITWVTQYVMYLYNAFLGFSIIIKIAVIILTLSCILIIYTLFQMLYNAIRNRRWRRVYNRLDKRYGDAIKYILSEEAGSELSRRAIVDILDLDGHEKPGILHNFREKWTFARLVYHYRISDDAALNRKKNLHILLNIFEMPMFLKDQINKGKTRRKAEALNMFRAFKLPVDQWISNGLRNAKRLRLRRLAMYASIMTSSNSDLEYFESEFFDLNCCIYDEIQLGYVLQRRLAMKRQLPNLAQLANMQSHPESQAIFVKFMRLFNQKEYCEELEELFKASTDNNLTQQICRTWGYLKYLPGEKMMQDIILTQPDDIKITIMHALTRMGTGESIDILEDGYKNSGDEHVRYEALRCLYNYGQGGRAKFYELQMNSPEEDRKLFEFFNNPLTVDKTELTKEYQYETHGEENLYSVV